MARARLAALLWLAAIVWLGGCGANSSLLSPSSARHAAGQTHSLKLPELHAIPAPRSTGTAASAADVEVIEGWATALAHGEVRVAAAYFNLPSEFVNGIATGASVPVIRIRTIAEAEAVNESLPCGATLMSADRRGQYVNALFRLTGRSGPGGSSCASGAGATARTNFLIEDGRILAWIRAPDDPGDNGGATKPESPSSPGATALV